MDSIFVFYSQPANLFERQEKGIKMHKQFDFFFVLHSAALLSVLLNENEEKADKTKSFMQWNGTM